MPKRLFSAVWFMVLMGMNVHADVAVSNVVAQQRYPWNGMVDVTVTLAGPSNELAQAYCNFVASNNVTHVALPVTYIDCVGNDVQSDTVRIRRYVWNAAADAGEVKIDDVVLTCTVETPLGGVQLWANGPYWAECNVGATNPQDYGYYFWWGDTVGYRREGGTWTNDDGEYFYSDVTWVSSAGTSVSSSPFKSSACPTYGKSNSQLQSAGYVDLAGNLVAAHDAATVHLGASWRMPTDAELSALAGNCDVAWTVRSGVYGCLFTGKGAYASKSIFLPAAGDGEDFDLYCPGSEGSYWSSTAYSGYSSDAWFRGIDSDGTYREGSSRYGGQSVRPLRDVASGAASSSAATTHLALDPGAGQVRVTAVAAQQRYPWNGLVDITVTMSGSASDVAAAVCTFVATNSATQTALTITNVTETGTMSGAGNTWVRRYVWNATTDLGEVKIAEVVLGAEAEKFLGGVQLWENGPYWAECNVGASKPEEYGYYFWWGDTVGYTADKNNATWTSGYYWNGVTWVSSTGTRMGSSPFNSSTCPTYGKSNSQLQSAGYIDSTGNLVAAHDAATVHLGAPWRMPTDAEMSALISNCDTTWTTQGGVYGRLVKGRGTYASKSIFLPAAGYGNDSFLYDPGSNGYFWSSTPYSDYSYCAWCLGFSSSSFGRRNYCGRGDGQSVRPVRGFAQ